jgi:hypothetical protein
VPPSFGTRGSQVQILPLRPACQMSPLSQEGQAQILTGSSKASRDEYRTDRHNTSLRRTAALATIFGPDMAVLATA